MQPIQSYFNQSQCLLKHVWPTLYTVPDTVFVDTMQGYFNFRESLYRRMQSASSMSGRHTFTPSSTALMTLVTDATFSLSSKSMPSSITWSAQRMRLARLWYTRLWQEDSAELLKGCWAKVRVEQSNGEKAQKWRRRKRKDGSDKKDNVQEVKEGT